MRKFAALLALLMLLPCAAALAEGEVVLTDDSAATVEEVVSGRALQYGDEGDDVLSLQRRLTDLFYYTGNLSGRYREGTRAAIGDFQQKMGQEANGITDPATQELLTPAERDFVERRAVLDERARAAEDALAAIPADDPDDNARKAAGIRGLIAMIEDPDAPVRAVSSALKYLVDRIEYTNTSSWNSADGLHLDIFLK